MEYEERIKALENKIISLEHGLDVCIGLLKQQIDTTDEVVNTLDNVATRVNVLSGDMDYHINRIWRYLRGE